MAAKKTNKRRKTFKFPTDGPLHGTNDDWEMGSSYDLPPDTLMPNQEEVEAQQLKMIRDVFAFENLAWRGFKTILMSILFFSVATSIAGGLFGFAFPNYCRFIFGAFDRVDFKPWVGGLAQGLVWGALAGALIGSTVVLSVALYQSRSWKNMQSTSKQPPPKQHPH